ncbi:MAG: DUF547 domain-containing protein [Desulfosarcina sp.]|nr:DUF547 domain-containing protein [Desulfobacterales bacterium]
MQLMPAIAKRGIQMAAVALVFMGVLVHAAETRVDHSLYARLLKQYVADGMVDYKGFKNEEAALDRYLEVLAAVDPATLSDPDRFAFYANAYNAWTIKLILMHYPGIESIKETGSFFRSPWKKRFVRLEGRLMTLDEIEHDTLRAQYRDPRIHFAVNCASKSCPPLYHEPFEGQNLEYQLNDATGQFINDPVRYRLEGRRLSVSKIFNWYGEDFNDDPVGYFLQFAEGDLKTRLAQQRSQLKVDYLDYDWSLNEGVRE